MQADVIYSLPVRVVDKCSCRREHALCVCSSVGSGNLSRPSHRRGKFAGGQYHAFREPLPIRLVAQAPRAFAVGVKPFAHTAIAISWIPFILGHAILFFYFAFDPIV